MLFPNEPGGAIFVFSFLSSKKGCKKKKQNKQRVEEQKESGDSTSDERERDIVQGVLKREFGYNKYTKIDEKGFVFQ